MKVKKFQGTEIVWISLIILLGSALRIIGTDWGFPLLLHPDEHSITDHAFELIKNRTLDPQFYAWPAHISIYINALTYHLASWIKFKSALVNTFTENMTFYYLLGRFITAISGALTILIAYFVGKEYDTKVGILAACLFAFFPPYVVYSHYSTPDMPLALFVLLVVLFSIKYLKNPTNLHLFLLCLFSAVAVGQKYPGGLSTVLIALVILIVYHKSVKAICVQLVKAGVFFCLCLFIFTPMFYFKVKQVYWTLLKLVSVHPRSEPFLGVDGLGFLGNLIYYMKVYFSSTGYILLLFLAVGTVTVIRKHRTLSIPLFSGLLYWTALSFSGLHLARWATPMYISPLILTAYGAFSVYEAIKTKKTLVATYAVITSIGLLNLFVQSLSITSMFTLQDTRYLSYQFCVSHDIRERESIYEKYTPFSPSKHVHLNRIFEQYNNRDYEDKQYIIVSSYIYERFLREKERYQFQVETYKKIFALPLVKEFTPVYFPLPVRSSELVTGASELTTLNKCVRFLLAYFTDKENMAVGPTIKIYSLSLEKEVS